LEKLRLNKKYWLEKDQQYYEGWLKFKEKEKLRIDNFDRVENYLTVKIKNKVISETRFCRRSAKTRSSFRRGSNTSITSARSWELSSRRTQTT